MIPGSPSSELIRPLSRLTLANRGNWSAIAVIHYLPVFSYKIVDALKALKHLSLASEGYKIPVYITEARCHGAKKKANKAKARKSPASSLVSPRCLRLVAS